MFIVGVVGVVGVVAGHDNHDRYSAYSEYDDSQFVMEIKEAETRKERIEHDVKKLKQEIADSFNDVIEEIKTDEDLIQCVNNISQNKADDYRNNPQNLVTDMEKLVERKLEEELIEDKNKLSEIDEIILRIVKTELKWGNEMNEKYIQQSIKNFFTKIDDIETKLINFSQNIDERKKEIFAKLDEFERESGLTNNSAFSNLSDGNNEVEKAKQRAMKKIHDSIITWHQRIEANKKGTQFMHKHEKYLCVMVFGAVKSGKSSLGNFLAGKSFQRANFDNEYKQRKFPVFEMEEKGREVGDMEKDGEGATWFSEGVTDTTGAIQYFSLSGLRWFDSPGTGALKKRGDTVDMEELVNEYIPYTDLCVFLQNSSEPGLQADMKYIQKLSKENQEALVVITKSDVNEEDIDEAGNLVSCWQAKPTEQRKLQENDVCQRIKKEYPNIPNEKYRAISISTYLAKQAVDKADEKLYRDSNIDLFMKILGEKVNNDVIRQKEEKPKKNMNVFIDTIINGDINFSGIKELHKELEEIRVAANEYRKSIDLKTKKLVSVISSNVKIDVQKKFRQWNDEVNKNGNSVDSDKIQNEINAIISQVTQNKINNQIREIISDYEKTNLSTIQGKFVIGEIKKEYETVTHEYTVTTIVSRSAEGFVETVRSLFGKQYYTRDIKKMKKTEKVDLGTNANKLVEDLMPQIESALDIYIRRELNNIAKTYFEPQERYVDGMQNSLDKLSNELIELKFK